jgi:hypothetical protein
MRSLGKVCTSEMDIKVCRLWVQNVGRRTFYDWVPRECVLKFSEFVTDLTITQIHPISIQQHKIYLGHE